MHRRKEVDTTMLTVWKFFTISCKEGILTKEIDVLYLPNGEGWSKFVTTAQRLNGFTTFSMASLRFVYFCVSFSNRVVFPQPAGHKSGKVRKSGKSRSRSRGASSSPSRKGGKKGGKKSRSPSPLKTKRDVDLLSPDAMVNGYYIAHNAPQFLGFGNWKSGSANNLFRRWLCRHERQVYFV